MTKKFPGKAKKETAKENSDNIINNQVDSTETKEVSDEKEINSQQGEKDKLTDKSVKLEEMLAEMEDKYLRLSAEFDNYRKRTLKERIDLIKTAGEDIIREIIPVIDDLERAVGFINGVEKIDETKQGFFLIYKKMKEILSRQGLKEIDALHKEFDTDIHEAVTKIPAPEKKLKGKVVDVIEKGYFLSDKVVRYAKVVVGE